MNNELVSIVIPCYNNEDYVSEAVNSALSQTYLNVEVIVVDDGSTDKSGDLISKFGDKIAFIKQENRGAPIARNNGLKRSHGKYIKFLDADDILFPECLEQQVAYASQSEGVVFGDFVLLYDGGIQKENPPHSETSALHDGDRTTLKTFFDSPILTSTTLYKRQHLEQVGGFNPSILRGQETDLNLRLYLNGVDFEYRPQICYQYRQHYSPNRISVAQGNENFFLDYEQFLKIVETSKSGTRSAAWQDNRIVLARMAWRIGRRHQRSERIRAAKDFFSLAQELGGKEAVHGSLAYGLLVRLISPQFAERVSMLLGRTRGYPQRGQIVDAAMTEIDEQ